MIDAARPRAFRLLLALFFVSGSCGLVYQVVWLRRLTLVFGTTTFAVSAVVSAFMAGLGLGSFLSGRLLARRGRALRFFSACEIGVGAYALLLPSLIAGAERVFTRTVASAGLSHYQESVLKLLLSFALLAVPTSLMGATLPLLAAHAVERFSHLGMRVGSLYALNTLGAAVGCFLAGFYGVPLLGMAGTTAVAVSLNVAVGVGALLLERWQGARAAPAPPAAAPPAPEPDAPQYPAATARWALAAFAVSGFAGLGLEVVWTRFFGLVFMGTTYAFTTMLTVYLLGLAAGGLAFARVADRSADPLRLLGWLQAGIGLAVPALSGLFVLAPAWSQGLREALGGGWTAEAVGRFAVGAALLLAPTVLFGAVFPVAARLAARSLAQVGDTVGRLYALNVACGIAGATATGFVLIPWLGTDGTLRVLATLLLVLGLLTTAARPQGGLVARPSTLVAALAGGLVLAGLGGRDLSLKVHETWLGSGERIVFHREGAEATVMVADSPEGWRRIVVNGTGATNTSLWGRSINRLQGALPFLFERQPRHVLGICFGSGTTFATAAEFDGAEVDGVEISPQVIQAAPIFRDVNYDVVASSRFRLHLDDGRNYLLKSRRRYDVITMEPMHPAKAGVATLYTRDFYALCREKLEPGGVMSQWVPLYQLSTDDVRSLYRTFLESFPHTILFFHGGDTFMVGSDRPLDLSLKRMRERRTSPRLARDLAELDLARAESLLGTFLMGRENMARFAGDAPLVTDDRPLVEFTGPRSALAGRATVAWNVRALAPHAEPPSRYLRAEGLEDEALLRQALDARFDAARKEWAQAANR